MLARLLLVSAYLLGEVAKASDWTAAVAKQAQSGMSPPTLWAAITLGVEITGFLLVLSGYGVWLGAGMLRVFAALAAVTARAFWTMPPGQERVTATNAFLEHLGLVGGSILVASVAKARPSRA